MTEKQLPEVFVKYAADTLADTNNGLSGSQIVKYCNLYAVDFGVDIPVATTDWGKFGSKVPNKRTALKRNLDAFSGRQQFTIIKELSELAMFQDNTAVQELKTKLFDRYAEFATSVIYEQHFEPTGWERVDRAIEEMKKRLLVADNEEKYQAIGMLGRETLITIAQQVFVKDLHPALDGVDISKTDAKRMLEAYLQYEMGEESEKVRKFCKTAVDLGNQLTHDRNATKKAASICIVSVASVASLIQAISES